MDIKTHFSNLLKNSGLDEARQSYWIAKFESGQFTKEDEQTFINELENHLSNLNLQIFDKKTEQKEKATKLEKLNQQFIPELQMVAEQSEKIFEKDYQDFQNQALAVESKAVQHIEKIRKTEEAKQIAQIKSSFQS